MLDDFLNDQPQAYHFFCNAGKKKALSHAYLIETNGYAKKDALALAFVKYLFCPNHYTNSLKCNHCKQCQTIDDGNFLELEIISPDGMWIKKGQLASLQKEFSKKSIIGNQKIYILKDADQLNGSSANSILKFLEEPEEGITAILLVDNIYQVLPTIRSRCQIIRLSRKQEALEEDETVENVFLFLSYYENKGIKTLYNMHHLWTPFFKEKEKCKEALEILLLLYKDYLNYQLDLPCEYYPSYREKFAKLPKNNSVSKLCNKIKIIAEEQEKLKVNMNTSLLMDKILIRLERSEDF